MANHMIRNLIVSTVVCTVLAGTPTAFASGFVETAPSAEAMVVDGLLVRPLGLAATAVGATLWVVTLPFSLLGRNSMDAARAMVVEPAAFTFTRPLGEL